MKIEQIGSFINQSDSVLEYIPVVGAAVSLYHFGSGLRDSCIERAHVERKFQYLEPKSFSRFITLLIPLFGNLIVAIYDFQRRVQPEALIELSNMGESISFERQFERIQRETFWLPEKGRILQLPVAAEGGFKQFRKVYCVNSEESFLLAQTEYLSMEELCTGQKIS